MYVAKLAISDIRGFHGTRGVDLRFTRPGGEHAGWTVLAGRNGSGKTTLLRSLALALVGHLTGRRLVPDFQGWLSSGSSRGQINALVHPDPEWDLLNNGSPLREPFNTVLTWENLGDDRPGNSARSTLIVDVPSDLPLHRGPWSDNPRGWFVAGYGPFRRLGRGSSEAQRLMLATGPVSRLATLFNEDASLTESVQWLISLHLRRLEEREGAAELLEFVFSLLNDGLLPDGFRVLRVDSEGLWVVRDGGEIPLREMSDGYRTVTALVLDLVRHAFDAFGTEALGERDSVPTVVCPGVVLIDEIDAHLHVSWQKVIGDWLKRHFPRIQFIVTSHSPYICQSADPGGLIRLPGVDEDEAPRVVSEELYERVVYGSGDDALLTELFGIDSPYSERAEEKRRRLARLESAVLRGTATPEEVSEYEDLQRTLTSSFTARVDEVAGRIHRA
ncbi:AAA family ATPase [Thermobifida cellulosilytica]|uniref:AAA+ ATPase domain-containing protein n=1 Tax=Thermobifida cellulosilytica TB100 TaxID=665004 RepID=A0A147KJW5_THECS|nr:AAA family ATPase [Thermobifida cellulosilytica]KUP97584.1 hypothetical protein AC529_05860 [Thermobifida cellulosilytica TB100]